MFNIGMRREIAESPDEITPRLAYADWLEESGGTAELARTLLSFAFLLYARAPCG